MTEIDFEKELSKVLGGTFDSLGYKFNDSCFFLNRTNGFRNIVSFDFDGKNSFRILVGINYPYDQTEVDLSVPPDGARLCYFFTGGSFSTKPKDFIFKNLAQLDQHLERFKTYFESDIDQGFFGAVNTPEDYADKLTVVDCIVKYKIYKREQLLTKAMIEAKTVLESYKDMLDIPKIKTFIEEDVKRFIEKNS